MHRSKAACNQEKNNAWVLARGKDDKFFVRSHWLLSAFLVHIDPKSSLMFIKKISATYFTVQLIRRPLSLNMNE